jgi:hypothetical protein
MRAPAFAILALSLAAAACSTAPIGEQTDNVRQVSEGPCYAEACFDVTPADGRDLSMASLARVQLAGNFPTDDAGTYRIFQVDEGEHKDVVVALLHGDRESVWNLSDTIGLGVDSIDAITQLSPTELAVWVDEGDGLFARYHVALDQRRGRLDVERSVYDDFFAEDNDTEPLSVHEYAVPASSDERYSALPRLQKTFDVDFEETPGGARIYLFAVEGGANVVIGLTVGGVSRVYDTEAVVADLGWAVEIEPGYFDMSVDTLCPAPSDTCEVGFDAIAIDFELSEDGQSLASEIIEVELKHGVG